MLKRIQVGNILFIDLETVSAEPDFFSLSDRLKGHWKRKCKFLLRDRPELLEDDDALAEQFQNKAAIYAEFGKIVCISIGYIHPRSGELRLKSYYGDDEKVLLEGFMGLIDKHYNDPARTQICGHNIREFDIPYLCRRLIINGLELPPIFQLAGKKPWETKHLLDTMELWKFGDFKNFTALDLLAAVLDVDTPKDDIDGSMVGQVYWKEKDLERIAVYCEKDVVTVAQVLLRMMGNPLIPDDLIVFGMNPKE